MGMIVETVRDFEAGRERIRARRYGVVETAGGELQAVHLRPWPKLLAARDLLPLGPRDHDRGEADRCLLYYNQPRRMPNFLALKYVTSTVGTSYRTFRAALAALDAIAELKRADAIVCDAANFRLSDRFMARMGWEAHKPQRWHRNFIRRFYGTYPAHVGLNRVLAKPPAQRAAVAMDRFNDSGLVAVAPRC
ncbi:MAG TPA: hypothetical protein VFW73_06190 [Lacipirellulaceae bacterium]|nr:hypothetical protein [Lacipirellulaceae bacterium]